METRANEGDLNNFLVEADEAVAAIEGQDVIGRVGRGGRGHGLRLGLALAVKADINERSKTL